MTKIKANQLEIREILNDPSAQASETWKGTLRIATQAEVNSGSPYDNTLAITPETLAGFGGLPNNWLTANNGGDFLVAPSALAPDSIALGYDASVDLTATNSIAIGKTAAVANNSTNALAIGDVSVGSYASNSIAIGNATNVANFMTETIAIGFGSTAFSRQIVIGAYSTNSSTTADHAFSVKLGYGKSDANKNMLHLFSRGKLELYGDEAQFIFPNYASAGSPVLPSTTIDGGTVYDLSTNTLKFYNGTAWTELNSYNWLSANSGSDFGTAPTALFANAIALGHNSQALASAAIAVGSNVTASVNSVSLGINSDTLGSSSIAIGSNAQSGTGAEGATIAIGLNSSSVLGSQVSIGNGVDATTISPTDVQFSTKIGYGVTGTNKNMLHLFSKGKLELYGEEAQFVFPSYAVTGSPIDVPANSVEGGLIYDSVAKGLQLYDGASWSVVGAANNWLTANSGDNFITNPSALATNAIALGNNAQSTNTAAIAIGLNSFSDDQNTIALGTGTATYAASAIAIGNGSKAGATGELNAVTLGVVSQAYLASQVVVGNFLTGASVTPTDVQYSVKLGYGFANASKNMLHLFSKGKLELYGEEAQYIMPNYAATGSPVEVPAVAVEGGVIYDSAAQGLKVYDGASWSVVGAANNWLTANSGDNFTTAPSAPFSNSIALGKGSTSVANESISIGSNTRGELNSVTLGLNSGAYAQSCISIGSGTKAGTVSETSCIAMGLATQARKLSQVSIGSLIGPTSVTPTDVQYSVKIGYGVTANTNKNMLHLFSKGKLELYGESAQFIMPNYAAGSPAVLPSTATEGGVIYDSTLQGLKLYDGAAWQDVGGAGGGLQDVVDDASPQLGGHLDVNGYQINTPNLATDANTGQISIRPGTANWVGAGSRTGGNLFAAAGYATSDNHGGSTTIAAGKALGTGAGGSLTISGGATSYGTIAGTITVRGGYAGGGNGAIANFRGGASYGGFFGGSAIIEGGETIGGGGVNTRGGSVIIQGGRAYDGSPIGTNGNVILTAGAGAGNPGSIQLHPAGDHTGPSSIQFWNYTDTVHTTGMYVALEAPAGSPAVWSDYTLVLPNADGANGDVIETDGNGILSFADLKHLSINAQIGLEYTLVLTDDNKLVTMDNSSPNELIIPTNASVAFPIGTQILVEQEGTGTTTISGGGSPPPVTINSAGNFFDTASQYTTISLIKKATDTWLIVGDLA